MKTARVLAALFLFLVVLAAFSSDYWAPARYEEQFRDQPDAPPSARFPLGTDALGRDRLSRLMYGTRVSLLLAPAAALVSCLLAALLGGGAGLLRGWVDGGLMALTDLFLSLPWLFLLLTVRALLPMQCPPLVSVSVTFLLLGLLGWPAPARVVRAEVRRIAGSDFILQARAAGCGGWRILLRHLAPNMRPVLLAQFWVAVPVFILGEATLGMLGLGVSEPLPSWGSILLELEGSSGVWSQPWLLVPVVLLAAVVGCFQLVLPREDYTL